MKGRDGFRAKVVLAAATMMVVTLFAHTPAVRASTYDFVGNQINLQITTGKPDDGGFDITNVTGIVLGDQVSLAGGNPGPGGAISSDGMFIYDNILYPKTSPALDWYGLLVKDLAANPQFLYANIFGDPGTLYFYTSSSNGYPVANNNYSGALTATPLPPTWTMLMAGIIGLGVFFLPRKRKPVASPIRLN